MPDVDIIGMNPMGIGFGAVESLGLPGANICEHILSVVIPTKYSLYLHCILIHPDKFSRGAVRYTTGVFTLKANRITNRLIC